MILSIYGTSSILCELPEVAAAGSETFIASAFFSKNEVCQVLMN